MKSILKDKIFYAVFHNEIHQCKFESISLVYSNGHCNIDVPEFKLNIAGLGHYVYSDNACSALYLAEKGVNLGRVHDISDVAIYETADDAIAQTNELIKVVNDFPRTHKHWFDKRMFRGCEYDDMYEFIDNNYNNYISTDMGNFGGYTWNGMKAVYNELSILYNPIKEIIGAFEGTSYHYTKSLDYYFNSVETCKANNVIKVYTF